MPVSLASQFLRKHPFPSQKEEERKNRLLFSLLLHTIKSPKPSVRTYGNQTHKSKPFRLRWRDPERYWNYLAERVTGEKGREHFTVHVLIT